MLAFDTETFKRIEEKAERLLADNIAPTIADIAELRHIGQRARSVIPARYSELYLFDWACKRVEGNAPNIDPAGYVHQKSPLLSDADKREVRRRFRDMFADSKVTPKRWIDKLTRMRTVEDYEKVLVLFRSSHYARTGENVPELIPGPEN